MALWLIATRLLGPALCGVFGAAQRLATLYELIPDCGMAYASTLAISRDRSLARPMMSTLLGLQGLLSVLTIALCVGTAAYMYRGQALTQQLVFVLAIALVTKALKNTLRWLLRGFEMFGTESVSLVLERLLTLVLGAAALLAGYGLWGFVLVFAVVRLVDVAALYGYLSVRLLPLVPSFDRRTSWDLLRKGLPFAWAGAMITVFFKIGTVLLFRFRGDVEAGYYVAPLQVLEGLTLVPRVLSLALIPTMAMLFPESLEQVTALYRRGSKYLLVVGLPTAVFGLVAAGPFVLLLFGREFSPSIGVAQIIIPAAVFMFLSNFGETTLACINRWRSIVWISTLTVLLNLALNLLWIPGQGSYGAAWATFATEAFYFLATVVALTRRGLHFSWPSLLWRPLLATAVFALVLWATLPLTLWLAAPVASLSYCSAVLALRVFDKKELELALSLLRRGPAPPALAK
jgi:O-antigen/teichoic acid export membrane protein